MPPYVSNRCYMCQKFVAKESVCCGCDSGFCADHGLVLRTFGALLPGKAYYCDQCYEDVTEMNGTQSCYAEKCNFLTNDSCSVCQKPCCKDHSLVEHMPPPQRKLGTLDSVESQDPEQFQKLNKTTICDACASSKYLKRRGLGGGGGVLLIIIILVIIFSTK